MAGPAGEGTLFTSFSDPTHEPRAAEVMARIQARLQQPNARALYSYAAVQLWAQAVEKTGTTDAARIADILRREEFDTVLGTIGFDAKGDVTGFDPFVWFVWTDGKWVPKDLTE